MSPIGDHARDGAGRRSRRSVEYRAEQQRLAPYEALARLIIKHRAKLGLTQQRLAERMGTSHSAVSRMESASIRPSQRRSGDLRQRSRCAS